MHMRLDRGCLEQQGSDMVQIGEYTNNSFRIASNLTITVTFHNTEGIVVGIRRTAVRSIFPKQRAAWSVRVPYGPGIVHTDTAVQFGWTP